MKVIGTDKNGNEIAEVSVTELDTMFREIRAKTIDEFAEKLIKHISQMPSGYIGSGNVLIIAEQMKAGGK